MGVVNCHCGQCRRFHGHFGAYITVPRDTVFFDADATLAWYRSSAIAERGFCGRCGSSLFWKGDGKATVDVAAGSLDQPTGLTTLRHIFASSKGDYYSFDDGLERFDGEAPEPP
ncbi:Gfa-like protein [Azospirillum doebereinerae]